MSNRNTEVKNPPAVIEVVDVHKVIQLRTINGAFHTDSSLAAEIGCTLDATIARDLTCKGGRKVETIMAVRLSDGTVRMLGNKVRFSPEVEIEASLLKKLSPEERALLGYLPEPWKDVY